MQAVWNTWSRQFIFWIPCDLVTRDFRSVWSTMMTLCCTRFFLDRLLRVFRLLVVYWVRVLLRALIGFKGFNNLSIFLVWTKLHCELSKDLPFLIGKVTLFWWQDLGIYAKTYAKSSNVDRSTVTLLWLKFSLQQQNRYQRKKCIECATSSLLGDDFVKKRTQYK